MINELAKNPAFAGQLNYLASEIISSSARPTVLSETRLLKSAKFGCASPNMSDAATTKERPKHTEQFPFERQVRRKCTVNGKPTLQRTKPY
jgi:hypothetical protein